MKGKWSYVVLLGCLGAFGYLFVLNPGQVSFRLSTGAPVRTSLALVLFLAFLVGFGAAFVSGLAREAVFALRFWHHRRSEARREEGRRLFAMARGHAAEGRAREAGRMLRKAQRRLPGDAAVALELARADLAQGREAEAERRLKALLEDDGKSPEALALLLQVYRARSDREGQLSTLSRWLEADPDHLPSLRELRDLYRASGGWAEAARVQERLLAQTEGQEQRSTERRTLSELVLLASRGGRPAQVLPRLKRLVEEDGNFAAAYGALAEALEAEGQLEQAFKCCVRGYEKTGQAGLLLQAEILRLGQGRGEEMLKLYQKLGKRAVAPLLLRARLLIQLGRAEEALDLLERSDRGGTDPQARWLAGEALLRLRSFERAANAYRESVAGVGVEPGVVFGCESCGRSAGRWSWGCGGCGAVGSLRLGIAARA